MVGVRYACYLNITAVNIFTDKIDFMRDIIAYIIVLVAIIGVSVDGKVSLESVLWFTILHSIILLFK